MSEKFWEEYKNKLKEINDRWNYLDPLIYRYKKPENLPIQMWLDKLDDNPNYWEEYIADKYSGEKTVLEQVLNESEKLEVINEKDFESVSEKWKFLAYPAGLKLDNNLKKFFYNSSPIFVSENQIIIEITEFNCNRISDELGLDLVGFLNLVSLELKHFIKSSLSNEIEKYKIKLVKQEKPSGISFDDLVRNPQVFYPYKSNKNEATWEYLKDIYQKNLETAKQYRIKLENRLNIAENEQKNLMIEDIGHWYSDRYEIHQLLLENKFEEISDLGEAILSSLSPKPEICWWAKDRKILNKKYCANKPVRWDIFCEQHVIENDLISQSIRQNLIQQDLEIYKNSDEELIRTKFAYPTKEIVDKRKLINSLSIDYFLYLYPKLIQKQDLRIERFELHNIFMNVLKPVFEKYHYLKFGRPTISMSQKLRIMKKSDFKCALCKSELTEKEPHIDHIIPLIKGGGNNESNLQALCWECNLKKGSKILREKTE